MLSAHDVLAAGGGTEELAGFPDLAVAPLILSSASALTAAGSFDRVVDLGDQSGALLLPLVLL